MRAVSVSLSVPGLPTDEGGGGLAVAWREGRCTWTYYLSFAAPHPPRPE